MTFAVANTFCPTTSARLTTVGAVIGHIAGRDLIEGVCDHDGERSAITIGPGENAPSADFSVRLRR